MKRIILWNLVFLVLAFAISLYMQGPEKTLQYWMCDYLGYGFILTGQKMIKDGGIALFPIYIVGLTFNLVFGIMNKSAIHVVFCAYGIWIFADGWRAKLKEKRAAQ